MVSQICYTLRDEGSCKFGDGCRFSHDLTGAADDAAPAAASEKPAKRQGVCYRWKKGDCSFGDECKFAHPGMFIIYFNDNDATSTDL
jgi:hypothetical protein